MSLQTAPAAASSLPADAVLTRPRVKLHERRNTGATPANWNWVALLPALFLLAVFLIGPALVSRDPLAMQLNQALRQPTAGHWLGTDDYGRDLLARLLAGGRASLLLALAVVLPASALGGLLGGAAVAVPRLDRPLARVMEVALSLPLLVNAMFVLSILGGGRFGLWLTLTGLGWVGYARLTRDLGRGIMRLEYVTAARAIGAGSWWIYRRHVLPNILPQLLAYASLQLGSVILTAAELGFLGFGVQPPVPDWGLMLAEGRSSLLIAPRLSFWPVAAIACSILAFRAAGRAFMKPPRPQYRWH